MAKRKRKQPRRKPDPAPVREYTDSEGNVLALRLSLTPATIRRISETWGNAAASREDAWHRRHEMLFEYLAVSWTIAGLDPITDQAMLLGRYRLASQAEQDWVRSTIATHVDEFFPELEAP